MIPKIYLSQHQTEPPNIDGNPDKEYWANIPWSDAFVDIADGPTPRHETRMKIAWGSWGMAIVAWLEEPHLWATLTEHDSVIFRDNDFELFIDPDGDTELYGELEINALNTTWDLLLNRPYKKQGTPIDSWEIKGLKTAVHLKGTLNNPNDTDEGWGVEILIPWRSLKEISRGIHCPPEPGDRWRINFSRVQWDLEVVDGKYQKIAGRPEHNWVWSPMGEIDMHIPERWGYLEFA
jgi:hypothetical protein